MKKKASIGTINAFQTSAKKLCHLSMRYVGSLFEAVTGQPVGMLPAKHPGLHESRDLINMILICRAELNGMARMLIEADLITHERALQVFAEEYRMLTQAKADMLGVEVTDVGLNIDLDAIRKKRAEGN